MSNLKKRKSPGEFRRKLNLSFSTFIKDSTFYEPYKEAQQVLSIAGQNCQVRCGPNCSFTIRHQGNFEDHIERLHREEHKLIVNSWSFRLNEEPSQNDYVDDAQNGHSQEECPTQHEHALSNASISTEILHVRSDPFANASDISNFFNELDLYLNKDDRGYAEDSFNVILESRFNSGAKFESFKRITLPFIGQLVFKIHPNVIEKSYLISVCKKFVASEALQTNHIKRYGTFIPPNKIEINGLKVGYHVDLKQLCALILRNKSLVQHIINQSEKPFDAKKVFDVYDSELCCDPERRKIIEGTFTIEFGGDDFNVTKQERKYFGLYCSFTNIPIKDRLKRQDIFLLLIANRDKMAKANATLNDILQPVIKDLKHLMQFGVDVVVDVHDDILGAKTETRNIKVTLSSIVGDNLGEHELLGLRQQFHLAYICRECGANHKDIQQCKKFPLIAASEAHVLEYNKAVQEAEKTTLLREEAIADKITKQGKPLTQSQLDYIHKKLPIINRYGVVKSCAFMDLPNFNIWMFAPPDCLHDLALGVVPKLLDIIIRDAILTTTFTRQDIKKVLSEFPLYNGDLEGVSFDKFNRLIIHGKAVQKLEILARLQEIFLGHFDRSKVGFKLFKSLYEFCSLAFSFKIRAEDLIIFDKNSKLMIELCKSLDKNFVVFSKLHVLTHYSDLTRRYGPLVLFSTLKYERKHLFFKNISEITNNFTNSAFTFSNQHQMSLVLFLEKTNFLSKDFFSRYIFNECVIKRVDDLQFLQFTEIYDSDDYPYAIRKGILRKINTNNERLKYWIHAQSFVECRRNKVIYVVGYIYKLKQTRAKREAIVDEITTQLECLESAFLTNSLRWLDITFLHHRNDFLFQYDGNTFLMKGLM